MIMDTNKKYLYFNPTTDSVAAAVSVPVSGFVGMETTSSSNLIMYFRESTETDTLDITITRETGSDPKPIMEEIVNAINFTKGSTVVVADNFTGEYLTSRFTEISSLSDGFSFPVKINRPVMAMVDSGTGGFATNAGAGFSANSYDTNHGTIGHIQGEIITTLFINLGTGTGGASATTDGNQNRVIGKAGATANASVTKITEARNGVVYGAELICVETPAGTNIPTDIDVRVTTDSLTTGENIASAASLDNLLLASGSMAKGDRVRTDNDQDGFGGMDDHFVYLCEGANHATPGTNGAYSAGKFILRLFGAPTSNLNDIS